MTWEGSSDAQGRTWLAWVALAVAAVVSLALVLQTWGRDRALIVAPPAPSTPPDHAAIAPVPVGLARVGDTVAGAEPPVPDTSDMTVVAVDDLGTLQFIDVRTGDRRRVDLVLPAISATRVGVDTMVEVDGEIVMDANDAVVALDLDRGIVSIVAEDRRVVPSISPTAVWLVDDFGGESTPTATRFEPARPDDDAARPTVGLPTMSRAVAGTRDGVIVALPGRTAAVSTDGTRRRIASGRAIASDGARLAHLSCGPTQACGIVIGTLDDPDRARTRLTRAGASLNPSLVTGAFSPDGRRLAVALDPDITETAGGRAAEVLVIEVTDGRLRRRMTIRQVRGPPPLAWSPDGRWLVVGAGRAVQLWHADRGVVLLDDIGVATSVRGVLLLSGSVRAPPAG